jgi:hypothetical protein
VPAPEELVVIAPTPECTENANCVAPMVCEAGVCVEPPPPPVFQVHLRVNSEPAGARVMLDRTLLGRTPFEGVIESPAATVTISLRKTDYETERFTVSMSAGGEFARTVELQLSNPFGQTAPLADQLRRRRGSE